MRGAMSINHIFKRFWINLVVSQRAIFFLSLFLGAVLVQSCDAVSFRFEPTGNLITARSGHTATLLPNGNVLVAGGSDLNSCELYNPSTGTWVTTGSLAVPRSEHTATLLGNGK